MLLKRKHQETNGVEEKEESFFLLVIRLLGANVDVLLLG